MMRTSTRFALGLATAGVVAAGGSAITTSNDVASVSDADKVLGYGKVTSTGATVETIRYTLASDATTLSGGIFTVTQTLSGSTHQARMVAELSGSNTTSNACTFAANTTTPSKTDITCSFSSPVTVSSIVSIGLTVAARG